VIQEDLPEMKPTVQDFHRANSGLHQTVGDSQLLILNEDIRPSPVAQLKRAGLSTDPITTPSHMGTVNF